jgi:anti-anti-sigma factor
MTLVTLPTDGPIVVLDGELDAAEVDAVSSILTAALVKHGALVADLAGLRFLDCAGIGMLIGVQLGAQRRRLQLVLARPTPPVRRLLTVAAGVDLLEVYAGLDEALRAVGVGPGITDDDSGHKGRDKRGRRWTTELRPNSWRWPGRNSGSPTRSCARSTS